MMMKPENLLIFPQSSLIRPRAVLNPEVVQSVKGPLAHICFPLEQPVAYVEVAYCSELFELEHLQFSLLSHPSLFCHRSQSLTLKLKPECGSVKIFTGRITRNAFMHSESACEGYYSINNKTETDDSPRLCLGMGWGESHIDALSAEYQRKSDPLTHVYSFLPLSSFFVTEKCCFSLFWDRSKDELHCNLNHNYYWKDFTTNTQEIGLFDTSFLFFRFSALPGPAPSPTFSLCP